MSGLEETLADPMTGLSLGEILSQALRAANAAPDPIDYDEIAQCASGWELSRLLAQHIGVGPNQVYNVLSCVSGNLLVLLHSPEGWATLSEFASVQLCKGSAFIRPTVH